MAENTKKILLWFLDLAINVAIIFGLVIIIQTWIIAPFDVSGASMCDTLNVIKNECQSGYGEKIIINEAVYLTSDPERGDIVVFKSPNNEDKYFIKRIIGLPGETVTIKNGEVYVTKVGSDKEEKLNERYLNEENKGNTKTYFSNMSVFEVPENHYFLLGDNRKASTDSRSCFEGNISINCEQHPEKAFVPAENLRGKTWVVWWPIQNIRIIDHYNYNNSESLEEK
jgi:signal peptidase I